MSTRERKARRNEELNDEPDGMERPKRKRGRGRLRTLVVLLLLLGATLWLIPWFASRGPVRNRLIAWFLPELASQIQIGDLHVGWYSPISVDHLTLRENDSNSILECARLSTDRTLLDFLRNRRDLGTIHLEQPNLRISLRRDGSNLQDLLAKVPTSESSSLSNSKQPFPAVRIKVTQGKALIRDEVLGQDTSLTDVEILAGISAETLPTCTLNVSTNAATGGEQGSLAVDASCQIPQSISFRELGNGKVTYKCHEFPWVALQPLLAPLCPDLSLRGAVSGTMEGGWKTEATGPVLHAKGELAWSHAIVSSPSLLGPDVIEEPSIAVNLDAWIENDRLRLETCELVASSLQGSLTMDGPLEILAAGDYRRFLLDVQNSHQFSAKGKADLARIAKSLRHTLRLKDDVELDQGEVDFQCVSESIEGMRVIRGTIANERIEGRAGGQRIAWDEPTSLRWDLSATPEGWQLRELEGSASFAKVNGSGNLREGSFQAQADLKRLWETVGQFRDLGNSQLAGTLECRGDWHAQENKLAFQFDGETKQFRMSTGSRLWEEEQLAVSGRAEASLQGMELLAINSAEFTLNSGKDKLRAETTAPIEHPSLVSRIPLRGYLVGDLHTWRPRIEPFVRFDTVSLDGSVQLEFAGECGTNQVKLSPCKLELVKFQCETPGLTLNEPRVLLEGDVEWDQTVDALLIPKVTLTSSSLALAPQDVRIAGLASSPEVSGSAAFRGDAGKIVSWMAVKNRWTMVPQGSIEGTARVTHAKEASTYHASIAATSCSLWQWSPPSPGAPSNEGWGVLWEEPKLTCELDGKIDWPEQRITLEPLRLRGDTLELTTQGDILMSNWHVGLEGELAYDLRVLSQRFRGVLGPEIDLDGKQRQHFRLRGPLFASAGGSSFTTLISNDLQGEMALGWERLTAYGIVVGPQQLTANLERGVIKISPLQTNIAGGQLRLAPRIDLNQSPLAVVLDPPTQVQGIQVTPELVRSWLRFVAPIMADATTVQGQLSVELSGARIPLAAPAMASVAGRVVLDDASLEPGPFAQQIVSTLDGVTLLAKRENPLAKLAQPGQRWLSIPRQQIDFQMEQGRVYHRNLEARIGDVIVTTQGSVGLDQTMELLAEIPIQEKWVGNDRALAGLKGQTLRIPVHGMLTRPELDQRALADLGREVLGGSAERLIQDELTKGLQKLLGPK